MVTCLNVEWVNGEMFEMIFQNLFFRISVFLHLCHPK